MTVGLADARRRLLLDAAGIAVAVAGFAFVYGLAARAAGLSVIEAMAMSLIPFAGASQFAALGYLEQGFPWATIVLLTALLNSRHLLYSAALAPVLRPVRFGIRAAMAEVVTDEAFALSENHFRRLGRLDVPGYWIAGVGAVYLPWNAGTLAGALAGEAVFDPAAYGLDVVFPAAMAGLALGLVTSRRELVAAGAGAALGVVLAVAVGPGVGIIAGGLLGPVVALLVPDRGRRVDPSSDTSGIAVHLPEGEPRPGEPPTGVGGGKP